MKKAIVIGGSNGVGLAIVNEFMKRGYYVYIFDKVAPNTKLIKQTNYYRYYPCDLLDYDTCIFDDPIQDEDVEALMITAGIGRVARFEYLHPAEIKKLMQINSVAAMQIIRCFYERIKSEKRFYCGMMGSIAGLMSSPLFSVYAASKASIFRFIESINIELEMLGTQNRILNVSPASLAGTKFNGGENNLALVQEVAREIVDKLFETQELYIPKYEEIYKEVINRYQKDSHEYGLHSYQYKMESGRVFNENRVKVGYLSGTFDLFHVGHLNLLRRAKEECDYLIVGVHPSAAHKGKETFIPFDERKEIVAACKYVDKVVEACTEDSDAWELYGYNRLFVGSDYKGTERFERYEEYFKDKGVKIIYFPYTQGTSSTQIRNDLLQGK